MSAHPPSHTRALFTDIAQVYDVGNFFASFGLHIYWRFVFLWSLRSVSASRIVDCATGTGDIALRLVALFPSARIWGVDVCAPLLAQAKIRATRARKYASLVWCEEDIRAMSFASHTIDLVTLAFGLRNVERREAFYAEARRVLVPGGTLAILEFSQPWRLFSPFIFFYNAYILPRFARLWTSHTDAYAYLARSIRAFPSAPALTEELRQAGFVPRQVLRCSFGIVAIHIVTRAVDDVRA